MASALSVVLAFTVVWLLLFTSTVPPPAAPEASSWAAASVRIGAVSSIVPPIPKAPVPLAKIVAELNSRSPACMLTVPPPPALLASSSAEAD